MADQPANLPVAIIVLNWNGVVDTLECLASLRRSVEPVHTIVVDNGSTGSDVEQIRASGLADTMIETGVNLGYAEGNNVGLRYALDSASGFEVVGVLNNDTIVDPSCFGDLAKQLSSCGEHHVALTPTIVYADDPAKPWFAGGIVDRGWPRHLQPAELGPHYEPLVTSEWLTGCCILARSATWRHVGLFDPRYYLIFEDCEWSLRARNLGVQLRIATKSTIRHKVSRSFASGAASQLGSFYFMRNGLRFAYAFERHDLAHFTMHHLVRPTLSGLTHLRWRSGLVFRWLGAMAFVTGNSGRAPRLIARLAEWRA